MKNSLFSIFKWAIFLLPACGGNDQKPISDLPVEIPEIIIPNDLPAFNGDTAYSITAKQVAFGPRIPNTKAHELCGDFLINTLKKYGARVEVQSTTVTTAKGESLKIRNIIGRIRPELNKRIFLASHWDTRPFADQDSENPKATFDGASDGASGAGILLELIRTISQKPPEIGVDIVLFDAEDYGYPEETNSYCLGSQYFASHLPNNFYPEYGILLDMTSAPNATFLREGYSMQYASGVVGKVWAIARKLGYERYFINENSSPVIDDHYYINSIAGIPMIDVIHHDQYSRTGFGSYWHTREDNMKMVDKSTIQAVGHSLIGVIYSEKPESNKIP